jgi:hemolysin III
MNNNKPSWLESHISLHSYQNRSEELANGWTHLGGAFFSLIGAFILIRAGVLAGRPREIVGFSVFSASMFLLLTASGLYHLVPVSNLKRVLRILDHSNIYFLIAGTYTPLFVALNNQLSNRLLILIWGIAVGGIIFTLIFWGRYGFIHVFLYLAMGWMVVFIRDMVVDRIPVGMIKWIIAGGLSYTVGVVFYAVKKIPFGHAIWHLFVLGGCVCFYLGILFYLPGLS